MANKKGNDNNLENELINEEPLIKRTLMVAAYPALIKAEVKEDGTFYKGFLPGFTTTVEDLENEDECVEYLQDILDDEVENLVCLGKSLPFVEEDEKLLKEYPDHKIVYLDINVYATKEELEYYDGCAGDCASCKHGCCDDDCDCEEYYDDCDCCGDDDCDCCNEDDCDDDDCGCKHHYEEDDCDCCNHEHHHHHHHNHDCGCGEHHHHHEHKDDDCCKDKHKNCDCKNDKNKKNK